MNTVELIIGIVILAMAVFLTVSILLQSSKDSRLSGTISGGAETFFGKQKGRTLDSVLNKITIVVTAVFIVAVIAMSIIQGDMKESNNSLANTGDISDISDVSDLINQNEENTPAENVPESGTAENDALSPDSPEK